ncbi:MAG TPA: hypothetical protein VFK37_00310, partial [Bacillales bacterium]|nr:hypothetical protein [Bacillales bacterium]
MKKLSVTPKRWLTALHLLFSAILLGNTVVFIVLSIVAASTDQRNVLEACVTVMHVLSTTSIRASTIGVVVTGVLLSVMTKWGLFQFYWILLKEGMTLVVIGIAIFGLYFWTLQAVTRISHDRAVPFFTSNNLQLFVGIILQAL